MHLYHNDIDFWALANRAQQTDFDAALAAAEGGDGALGASAVGQTLFDAQGNDLGVLTFNNQMERLVLVSRNASGQTVFRDFVAGEYMLSDRTKLNISASGNAILLPTTPTGGTGRRSIAEEIQLLEAQAAIARREGDHVREADFRNQIEALKLGQEFQAGENVLSRENQVVLQRLSDLSSLQRQILSDQARGRELMAEMIGDDPIRAGALAQGLTPRRGTPADIFRGELQQTVDQPLVQPASMGIADINAAIQETQGNLGLPSPSSLGFNQPIQSAAHGGIIDMKKHKDGQFRVLVGEGGPELLEGNRNEIQITPIATAQGGGRISFTESPFATFDVPGFGAGPTRAPAPPRSLGTRPQLGATAQPGSPLIPTLQEILQELRGLPPTPAAPPVVGPPVAPPPAVSPPISTIRDIEFERPGGELVQGLESVFDFLGFDQVPTFTEGPFGGMQVPAGGLGAFNALGIDPSLLRTIEDGRGTNFFVTPSGELQQISSGGMFQQALGLGPGTDSGFRLEDFLTVDPSDLAARNLGAPTPFTGQGLASADDPFPTLRSPLTIPSEVTGDAGVFLPDPRTIASLWPRLPAAVKQNLLSAWGVAGMGRESVGDILNFFTPQGSFQNVAGFG